MKRWITATQNLYKENRAMAAFMEGTVSDMYRGFKPDYYPKAENAQDAGVLKGIKRMVRSLMGHAEETVVSNMSERFANMATSEKPNILERDQKMAALSVSARSELMAANETVGNMVVMFSPNKENGISMQVYNGTKLSGDENDMSHNPVLVYELRPSVRQNVEFPNNYSRETRGIIDGPDYSNRYFNGEKEAEGTLTNAYRNVTGRRFLGPEVKLFPIVIDVPIRIIEENTPKPGVVPQTAPKAERPAHKNKQVPKKVEKQDSTSV